MTQVVKAYLRKLRTIAESIVLSQHVSRIQQCALARCENHPCFCPPAACQLAFLILAASMGEYFLKNDLGHGDAPIAVLRLCWHGLQMAFLVSLALDPLQRTQNLYRTSFEIEVVPL